MATVVGQISVVTKATTAPPVATAFGSGARQQAIILPPSAIEETLRGQIADLNLDEDVSDHVFSTKGFQHRPS